MTSDSNTKEDQNKETVRSPTTRKKEKRKTKSSKKDATTTNSPRKPKTSSRRHHSRDEKKSKHGRSGSSARDKRKSHTPSRSKSEHVSRTRQDQQQEDESGSCSVDTSESELEVDLVTTPKGTTGKRIVSLSDMAASQASLTDSSESSIETNKEGPSRRIRYIPASKNAKKDQNNNSLRAQSEHSTSGSVKSKKDDSSAGSAGFAVSAPSQGTISGWEMRQKFQREFPGEPVPSEEVLRKLFARDKVAADERRERYRLEFPGEPVPSDEVLKKLYAKAPPPPPPPQIPSTTRREQLTRQNSDSGLTFASETTWEQYGQSGFTQPKRETIPQTIGMEVLAEGEEDEEETVQDEIPIHFDAGGTWNTNSQFHQSTGFLPSHRQPSKSSWIEAGHASTPSFPQMDGNLSRSRSAGEVPADSLDEAPISSIDLLEIPSDHRPTMAEPDAFQVGSIDLKPTQAGQQDALDAFHNSFSSSGDLAQKHANVGNGDGDWTDFASSDGSQKKIGGEDKNETKKVRKGKKDKTKSKGKKKEKKTKKKDSSDKKSATDSGEPPKEEAWRKREAWKNSTRQRSGGSRSVSPGDMGERSGPPSMDEFFATDKDGSQRSGRRSGASVGSGDVSAFSSNSRNPRRGVRRAKSDNLPKGKRGQRQEATNDGFETVKEENEDLFNSSQGPDAFQSSTSGDFGFAPSIRNEAPSDLGSFDAFGTIGVENQAREPVRNLGRSKSDAFGTFFGGIEEERSVDTRRTESLNDIGFEGPVGLLQPSKRERRRTKSAERTKTTPLDPEETGLRRLLRGGSPTTPTSTRKGAHTTSSLSTPNRGRPAPTPNRNYSTPAMNGWASEIPGMLIQRDASDDEGVDLEIGPGDEPLSPITLATKKPIHRPNIGRRRGRY